MLYLVLFFITAQGQELAKAKDEIVDLNEKLETLKLKRAKDQEKIKEYEKLKIQCEQLMEFKSKIMESQNALQRDVQKAKHEAKEAVEAKEAHAEEMQELSETVEMITLDKEMAEERAETLQIELEAAKEKIEELQLDLDIIKTEMSDDSPKEEGSGGSVTNFELKQLQAQNEKLRETLVRMRDLSAHEKNETLKLTKDCDELKTRNVDLTKQNDKYKTENETLESTINELQEQVDAALGAEEMVEALTTKCLDLEDKYNVVYEEKIDLEKLHEMDEELQEDAREIELELREDLDLANGKIRELERTRDITKDVIADHETTINKFRDLVHKVQEQNAELRSTLEKKKPEAISTMEMIDFKKMLADTKAFSKAIDMELRQCEVDQANLHTKYLSSYMSDSFTARGGDHEAILVLLLIPRMLFKVSILTSQIKDKFPMIDITKQTVLKGQHEVERYTFGSHMIFKLSSLESILNLYQNGLNCCSPEVFLKLGTLYPEMSAHEKAVDFYLELLRKDQLDENVPMDVMDKSLNYFQQIYPNHMEISHNDLNHLQIITDQLKSYTTGSDCLGQLLHMLQVMIHANNQSELANMLKVSEASCNEIKTFIKAMRRRLPTLKADLSPSEPLIRFDSKNLDKLTDVNKSFQNMIRIFYISSRHGLQQSDPEAGIPPAKLINLIKEAIDQVYEMNGQGLENINEAFRDILSKITDMNKSLQDGEWDDNKQIISCPMAPVILRAEIFKNEIKEAESMKYKLENKDLDIKDLKKVLKIKTEEMSEMQVRKDKAEKRLQDANREAELMREKLQRKLDDAQETLKRKEKEYEDTLEHLQKDMDSLESERGELKNRLKETTMKALLEGMARGSPSIPHSAGPISIGPSVPAPVKDSPMLTRQVQDLQLALASIREEQARYGFK